MRAAAPYSRGLTRKVRDCNAYVVCRVRKPDGSAAYCPRKRAVDEQIAAGRGIHIIPFKVLLGWLGIDEEELDRLAFPEKYADASEGEGGEKEVFAI